MLILALYPNLLNVSIDEKTKQVIWIYQEMISMNYYLHNEYIHLYFLLSF